MTGAPEIRPRLERVRSILDAFAQGCGQTVPEELPPEFCPACAGAMVAALLEAIGPDGAQPGVQAEDAFLLGWLDAIWCATSAEVSGMTAPVDVQSELLRRGWLRPIGPTAATGERRVTITPLGAQSVVQMNEHAGIRRHFVGEEDGEI